MKQREELDEGYATHGLGREMPDDGHKQTAETWERIDSSLKSTVSRYTKKSP